MRSIFQQVTPEIVFDLTESVLLESIRSLRAGKGEYPPTRRSRVRGLVGSHIGGTAKALMRWSGKEVVLVRVGRRRGFISCPRYAKHEMFSGQNAKRFHRTTYEGRSRQS